MHVFFLQSGVCVCVCERETDEGKEGRGVVDKALLH